jgi:hypothetical protein
MSGTLIDTEPFTIEYKDKTWNVRAESFGPGDTVYLVMYKGGGLFMALTRAKGLYDPKFWATIPENSKRHEEAQQVGELIFKHFNPDK